MSIIQLLFNLNMFQDFIFIKNQLMLLLQKILFLEDMVWKYLYKIQKNL